MWERFGFYMVQAILMLFMVHALHYEDRKAFLLYGVFGSMIYLTPVIGGYVADRWIGFRNAIVLGGVLLAIGYALMAFRDERIFFLGMEIVIIGNGFFKPNVSSIVGELYRSDDPRRDSGFTIFYMGINIGALIPPLISGYIVNHFNWEAGFALASVGMIVATVVFISGYKLYQKAGRVPVVSSLHRGSAGYFGVFLGLGLLVALVLLHFLLIYPAEGGLILAISGVVVIAAILFLLGREAPEQRRKFIACLILIFLSMGFWAIYNQMYTSLMLFADRNMIKEFMGFQIDPEFTQFFNPFYILLLAPFLGKLWIYLNEKELNPSTPIKFSFGLLFMAAGMLGLAGATYFFSNDQGMTSPWWLAGCYLLETIGELLLSPIGLAMVTRLAPPHLRGMMMGVWFLATSAAFAIGGGLATLSDVPIGSSHYQSIAIYSRAFLIYGTIALGLAIVGFIIAPFIRRLIEDRPVTRKRR
jgi:POT family proton-dependent oligopeptide transporter